MLTTSQKWESLKKLGVNDLDSHAINEMYLRAIRPGIKRITGVYPGDRFRIDAYASIEDNAARFQAEILDAKFGGDVEMYDLVRSITWFRLEGGKFRGSRGGEFDLDALFYVLNYATGGKVPELRPIGFVDDIQQNTDRPFMAYTWAFTRAVEINGHKFDLRGFKNGYIQIKGLTPVMLEKIEALQEMVHKYGRD